MSVRAYGSFLALKREEPKSDSPIVIPESVRAAANCGRIVSVGEDVKGLKVGDVVVFIGLAFEVYGVLLVKGDNVLAVIEAAEAEMAPPYEAEEAA